MIFVIAATLKQYQQNYNWNIKEKDIRVTTSKSENKHFLLAEQLNYPDM